MVEPDSFQGLPNDGVISLDNDRNEMVNHSNSLMITVVVYCQNNSQFDTFK